jgi:peroxiredoxin
VGFCERGEWLSGTNPSARATLKEVVMTSTDTTYAGRRAALARDAAERLPAEITAVFAIEAEKLSRTPPPDLDIHLGTALPDVELLDADGEPTTVSAARAEQAVVIVFYRGAWCPYCNLILQTYQDSLVGALDARGVRLLAVSPQKPEGSLSARQTHALTYTVVSDPGNQLARHLGILTAPSPEAQRAQRRLGLDLTEINADGTAMLPMPTVIIVDADGIIRWLQVQPDYTARTEPVTILEAVDATLFER